MPRPARRRPQSRRGGPALLLTALMASVAACSSAPPPPSALDNDANGAASVAPEALPSASASALAVPVTKTLADGTKVTTVVRNGQVVTTVTKNGKTTTTTKPNTSKGPSTTTAARSRLFTAAEDKIGITPDSITLCAHAALTYGAAFKTTREDLNVFWAAVNDNGGVFGRKVSVTYENDDYKPTTAVEAAGLSASTFTLADHCDAWMTRS